MARQTAVLNIKKLQLINKKLKINL
jgi:hypothetical protein